jgi:hypothetical protein
VESLRGKETRVAPPFVPTFPGEKDALWLVAVGPYGHIDLMTPVGDRVRAQAAESLALPLGWTLEGGRAVSLWAPLAIRWTGPAPDKTPVCAKTGRPALPAEDPIDITVSQIIPPSVDPCRNPYGDGRFKVTVTNRGDRPVTVPALLADGKNILWADCCRSLAPSSKAGPARCGCSA